MRLSVLRTLRTGCPRSMTYGDLRVGFAGWRTLLLPGVLAGFGVGLAAVPWPAVRPERVRAIRLPWPATSAIVTLIER